MIPLKEYLTAPDTTRETITKPEAQDIAKKLYGAQQKFGFINEPNPLCKQITTRAESMINRLEAIPPIGTSHQDIYIYTTDSQSQLNQNLKLLVEQKTTPFPTGNPFETKLQNARLNSTPLNFSTVPTPKTPLERFEENPLWLYQEERMNQNRAVCEMGKAIGTLVKEAISGIVEEISENIEHHKQEAFNPSNPRSLFHIKEKQDPS